MLAETTLVSPLPGLGILKSGNHTSDSYGGLPIGDPRPGSQTPTSSADPASERIDPVLLLSRPVEGFNHPRQHLFTDRLLGRFYQDSSLDAETRKTSKCLAGRLGTAGSHSTTRPNTAATTNSHFRPSRSRSPTTTRRGGKRMHGSSSAQALGSSREPGTGLAGRKEQIQKEILEQKALIERLEGRVASLSDRGRRSSATRGSSAPPQEDRQSGASCRKQDTDDRPTTTPQQESIASQGKRGAEHAGDECSSAVQDHSQRRESSGSKTRRKSANKLQELPDHGPNARRDSLRLSSMTTSQSTCTGRQQEERCAVTIQRNVRGTGRRKKFLTLQSAREDFERHLQTLVSAAETALAQQQQQLESTVGSGIGGKEQSSGMRVGSGGTLQGVSAAAVRLLETGREDGLAKPPFHILREMYSGIEDVTEALASIPAGEKTGAGMDAGGDGREGGGGLPYAASMVESCGAAKEALDAIREAVGADIADLGDRARSSSPSACSSPIAPGHPRFRPVGSGRAAAAAMAPGRGGMLVSPEDSSATCAGRVAGQSSGEDKEAGKEGGRTGSGERRHHRPVPLRTLDVKSVAQLLRLNGFEEDAPGFVAQGVDGIMLSDPNLCEADFAELGLGGGDEGGRNGRARMVSFFRRCQQEGAVFSANGGSSQDPTRGIEQRSGDQCAGDSNLDKRRRENQTGTDQGNSGSPEESPWRRGSVLVDRENQRVLAQITLDPSETGRNQASSGVNESGRRMSVKLNNGVVVTAGGREEGLVGNVDALLAIDAETEAAAAASERAGDEAVAETSGGGVSEDTPHGRRMSIGLRTTTIYKEPSPSGEGSNSHIAEDLPLAPAVAITASDETVNVFQ